MEWVATVVAPNCERRVERDLRRQDIAEIYSPRFRDSRFPKNPPRSLFPGYIFARVAAATWRVLLGTRGVLAALTSPVLGREIERLRASERGGLVVVPESDPWTLGATVHLQRLGCVGVIDACLGASRVRVDLGHVRATVDVADLVLA